MTEQAPSTPPADPQPQAPAEEPAAPAPAAAADAASAKTGGYIWGTGRRKSAVARVRIRPGTGKFLVNKREVAEYFRAERDRRSASSPLAAAEVAGRYDIWANVHGGGSTGQADAVMLGLARALVKAIPQVAVTLRDQGLLTRDSRARERKKYGQKGARKRFQFSKR